MTTVPRIVTFTNLFPSSVMPTHGVFVPERMQRVAAATGYRWSVVAPVPAVAWFLRNGTYRRWANVPEHESWRGVDVVHPRYRHWPGLSLRRQAAAMAAGARAAVERLAADGPIVIDAHYVWPDGVAAAEIAEALGVPFVVTARGTDLNVVANDPVVGARIAGIASRALACCAVSGALADRFAAIAKLPRERVLEVRNGVDLERFCPGDATVARAELGLSSTGRLVLGVGRLVPGKGFDIAARAMRSLPDDTQLVLVGDGPERETIRAAAGTGRVVFLGALPPERVAVAYRAADVLVLPSEREGWPNVITEALASGLRVVATKVGGIPEILGELAARSPGLAAIVPPRDDAAFATALGAVLATPGDKTAVRAFAMRYGWDEPVAVLANLFRRAFAEVAA